MKQQKNNTNNCAVCAQELTRSFTNDVVMFYVCSHPACPNYSLVTLGMKGMPKKLDEMSKKDEAVFKKPKASELFF